MVDSLQNRNLFAPAAELAGAEYPDLTGRVLSLFLALTKLGSYNQISFASKWPKDWL